MKWKWISGEKNLRRNKFLLFFYITICVFNYPSVKLVSPATWSLSKHLCSSTECPVMLLYSIMFWFCMNWWVKQTVSLKLLQDLCLTDHHILQQQQQTVVISYRCKLNRTEQNPWEESKKTKLFFFYISSKLFPVTCSWLQSVASKLVLQVFDL